MVEENVLTQSLRGSRIFLKKGQFQKKNGNEVELNSWLRIFLRYGKYMY